MRNMLFQICGCTKEEARLVAETFIRELDLSDEERDAIRHRRYIEYEKRTSKYN